MAKADLRIDWATHEAAKYACVNWHYSGCLPSSLQKRVAVGAWERGKFVGVVVFGHGANPQIGSPYGLTINECVELTRIALKPKHSSPVSRIVRLALKFLKESAEYKIASIDPSQIIGCLRLYTFNVKTRVLTEYVSEHVDGIRVKGTTLQNINIEKSRCTRLRKPEEFLSIVLSKTPTQINKEWSKLTTKTNQPNARINGDTILLKIKG